MVMSQEQSESAGGVPLRRERNGLAAGMSGHRHGKRKRGIIMRDRLIGMCSIVIVLVMWQLIVDLHLVQRFLLSSPTGIAVALYDLFVKQNFLHQVLISAYQFAIGYAGAVIIGVVVGLMMGWFRSVRAALQPIVSAIYSTPTVALIPLFVVWFGVGNDSKIFMVMLAALFPVLLNTVAGTMAAPKELLEMSASFGATRLDTFRTILLPSAVPFIMTGLRLAVGVGVILTIVGEMLAGTDGIGYVIQNAGQTFDTREIFAGVIVVAVAATILIALLRRIERHFDAWRPSRG